MFRKTVIALSIALLVLVAGCKGSSSASSGGNGGATATTAAPAGTATAAAGTTQGPCPAKETKHFAKTLFVVDAGVAAGAFKHWIYTPYQQGAFKAGAPHRVTAIVKAAIAGAFVVDRLLAVKKNAEADPFLCKLTIAPVAKLTSAIQGLVSKAKHGSISPADVQGASGSLDQLRSAASSAGAAFKDRSVPIPGLS